MAFSDLAGFDPELLTCGRVLAVSTAGQELKCGSALVEWVPIANVDMPGGRHAEAVMGGLLMCSPCRLTFSLDDLWRTSMWRGMLSGMREEWGEEPKRKHVEIVWRSAHDHVKDVTTH